MLKRIFAAILLALSALTQAQAQTTLFPYPEAPEHKVMLSEKCNYLVWHFWDKCNIKKSFSQPEQLSAAFGDWISFMPYATADTVHLAIDRYIGEVERTGGKNLAALGRIAEHWLATDTAEYQSDELFMPFCTAVAECDKAPKADREHFAAMRQRIENSAVGAKLPPFDFVDADGNSHSFADVVASRIILFIFEPGNTDCILAKARLSSDYCLSQLIDKRLVSVIAIYAGDDAEAWQQMAASMPNSWVVGAAYGLGSDVDIAEKPDIYYLDAKHTILSKHVDIENLMLAMQQIMQQMQTQQ